MVRNTETNKGQERPERATLRRSSEHKSKLTTASDLLASTMDVKSPFPPKIKKKY